MVGQPVYCAAMTLRFQPLQLLLVIFAGWVNRHQLDVIEYLSSAIERLAGDGWQAEGETEYGFVFIRRDTEQRLLMLTPRDPFCA
jgi:hypothetical protein